MEVESEKVLEGIEKIKRNYMNIRLKGYFQILS